MTKYLVTVFIATVFFSVNTAFSQQVDSAQAGKIEQQIAKEQKSINNSADKIEKTDRKMNRALKKAEKQERKMNKALRKAERREKKKEKEENRLKKKEEKVDDLKKDLGSPPPSQ